MVRDIISVTSIRDETWRAKFANAQNQYNVWFLLLPVSGVFSYQILHHKGNVSYGDLVFCPPETTFKRKVIEPISFFKFRFVRIAMTGEANHSPAHTDFIPIGKITINDLYRFSSNLKYLYTLSKKTDEKSLQLASHIISDMINLYHLEQEIKKKNMADYRSKDPLVNDIIAKIKNRAFEPIYLKDIAKEVGLTPVQFTRRFTSVVGVTPMNYVQTLRLERAQMLLLETNATIDSIAGKCGYDDPLYFSRLFSKQMGLSPTCFRKKNAV